MSFLLIMELLVIGLYILHLVFFLGMRHAFLTRVSFTPLSAQSPEVPLEENPLMNTVFESLHKLQVTQINIMRMINSHTDAMNRLDERLRNVERKITDIILRNERDLKIIYDNLMLLNSDVHNLRKEAVIPAMTRVSLMSKGIQDIPTKTY